jgi:glycogen synthase
MELYGDRKKWKTVALNGMAMDYTWRTSAEQYLHLYGSLIATRT